MNLSSSSNDSITPTNEHKAKKIPNSSTILDEVLIASDVSFSSSASSISSNTASDLSSNESASMVSKKRKRKTTKSSLCWNYFTAKSATESTCNLCSRSIITSGNTTNAWNHLQTYHKHDYYKLTDNNPKGNIFVNLKLIQSI
jgi:hypothetical protein